MNKNKKIATIAIATILIAVALIAGILISRANSQKAAVESTSSTTQTTTVTLATTTTESTTQSTTVSDTKASTTSTTTTKKAGSKDSDYDTSISVNEALDVLTDFYGKTYTVNATVVEDGWQYFSVVDKKGTKYASVKVNLATSDAVETILATNEVNEYNLLA